MNSTPLSLRAALGSALATALLTMNLALASERLTAPSLLAPPPSDAEMESLFGPLDMLLAQQPKDLPKAPTPAVPVEQTPTTAPTVAPTTPSVSGALAGDLLGGARGAGGAASEAGGGGLSASQQAAPAASSNVVSGAEAVGRASSDAGDLLGKSISSTGVWIHHLSPVASEPIIRGYRLGQIYTQVDGGLFIPARQDLDTALGKIESTQIKNVVIIKGPYSVRYGPGFSFIDIETLDTPRYECGWQTHGSTSLTYKTNGQQWRGLQTVFGGNENMGFRFGYDIGVGNDYVAGNGFEQLSSYNIQNWNAGLGYSFNKNSRFEVKAFHLQEHPLELPGTIYNISNLITDSVSGRLVIEEPERYRFFLDSWFNYTRFRGDDLAFAKKASINQISNFRGVFGPLDFTTEGDLAIYGGRGGWTFGPGTRFEATLGADFRSINQHANNFGTFPGVVAVTANVALPRSNSLDPGVFFDLAVRPSDRFTVKAGARVDWVTTNIEKFVLPPPSVLVGPTVYDFFDPVTDFNNQFTTWTAFVTPEFKLTDEVTLFAGYGVGQRPPTLNELYSVGSFVSMIQQPLTLLVGNPLLAAERGQQVDLGFRLDYQRLRAGATGYAAWIHNYITYEQFLLLNGPVGPFPDGVPIYYALNTDRVRLAGFEAYGEFDATPWLMPFGTVSYVRADNLSRDFGFSPGSTQVGPGTAITAAGAPPTEPVPMMPPLEARLGIRLHDPSQGRWAVEFISRIVNQQNHVANTLFEQRTPGYTIFDLRSYWRASDLLLLTAGIENIGDKTYFEALDSRTFNTGGGRTGVFQPGFNAYVGARLTY